MRRIEHYRREFPHDRQRPHVDDEIVVAETRTALGEEDCVLPCVAALLDRMPHVPGRNKLAFLDIDDASAQRRRDD